MTIHYHGTPITPGSVLTTLAGRHFCVSHARPENIERVHEIGQSVMLDNGAFSKHTRGHETNWADYYAWCDKWFSYPTTWAVVPDEIDAGSQQQDALLREWPFSKQRGAPVWHMNEPIDRLLRLIELWPRVCIGSTDEFWRVLSPEWEQRMDETWNEIAKRHRHFPWIHMLRGMQLVKLKYRWPFASVDSTDIGKNHNRLQNEALDMAMRWDAMQCSAIWEQR